jgi:hypothetical protein
MDTRYNNLITDLKQKLSTLGYKHKDIFKIINNMDYDQMNVVLKNTFVIYLIECIVLEREKIGDRLEHKLNDLSWLNDRLINFNLEPQETKTKALNLLKDININIYDLEAEQYEAKTDYISLRKDLRKYPERRYSLINAKENITLKCFLKKI